MRRNSRSNRRPLRIKRVSYDPEYIAGLNYKSASQLRKFISDRGKILSRRHTGLSAKQQRHVARQIRLARYMGLLHYTSSQLN